MIFAQLNHSKRLEDVQPLEDQGHRADLRGAQGLASMVFQTDDPVANAVQDVHHVDPEEDRLHRMVETRGGGHAKKQLQNPEEDQEDLHGEGEMLNVRSIVDEPHRDVHRVELVVHIASIDLGEFQKEFISRDDHLGEKQIDRSDTDRAEEQPIARAKERLVVLDRSPDPSLHRRAREITNLHGIGEKGNAVKSFQFFHEDGIRKVITTP